MMPGVPERRTHDYLRHGVTSLFAVFNIADGTVIGQLHRRHRAIEFRKPRFHVHFTPTGSSWINQVERWFGLLTDKLLRRGVHTSVQALEQDVRAWIDTWNTNPRPFTWTRCPCRVKPRRDGGGTMVPARTSSHWGQDPD